MIEIRRGDAQVDPRFLAHTIRIRIISKGGTAPTADPAGSPWPIRSPAACQECHANVFATAGLRGTCIGALAQQPWELLSSSDGHFEVFGVRFLSASVANCSYEPAVSRMVFLAMGSSS
jgi:hypothetical protein